MAKKLIIALVVLVLTGGGFIACTIIQENDRHNWTQSSENLLKLKKQKQAY